MPRIDASMMMCPHCRVTFESEGEQFDLGWDPDGLCKLRITQCESCRRFLAVGLLFVERKRLKGERRQAGPILETTLKAERTIWPPAVARTPIPENVPESIAKDYSAACRVLPESAEASAALSRRCLQNLLVEKAGVKKRDLAPQIQEVIDAGILPREVAEDLDVVRTIGNFGAHPIKSQTTGQIVEVEDGEAEWNLSILEKLFEFFYVQAKKRQQRRAALNEKLKDAGKPPLK